MQSEIQTLSIDHLNDILTLLHQIYPDLSDDILIHRTQEIFSYQNYICWGYFEAGHLLGICAGWITERFYCGKQLEIDNFIVEENHRQQGIGEQLIHFIENFAREIDCKTIELNSYVTANKAHKFYFRNGYRILGFHFEKNIVHGHS